MGHEKHCSDFVTKAAIFFFGHPSASSMPGRLPRCMASPIFLRALRQNRTSLLTICRARHRHHSFTTSMMKPLGSRWRNGLLTSTLIEKLASQPAINPLLFRLFTSFALVGIRPDFTLLDERQNAGKMEKPDAFYPSWFTNGDGSDKTFGRPFVEFCPRAAGIKFMPALWRANPDRQITIPVGHELGCAMRRGTAAAIKRVSVRWQCWTDVHKRILPLLRENPLCISSRNSCRRRVRSAMMFCLASYFHSPGGVGFDGFSLVGLLSFDDGLGVFSGFKLVGSLILGEVKLILNL